METAQFNETQKKQLEKVYAKIFENHHLTEEGRNVCLEAQIKPNDLRAKNFEEFKQEVQVEDVAKIRFDHYQLKRLSKFFTLFNIFLQENSIKFRKHWRKMPSLSIKKLRDALGKSSTLVKLDQILVHSLLLTLIKQIIRVLALKSWLFIISRISMRRGQLVP